MPILVLTFSIPVLTFLLGAERVWPVTAEKFARVYAAAEGWVPQILVAASLLASAVAALAYASSRRGAGAGSPQPGVSTVFLGGVRELMGPVAILLAAWMLGSGIQQLGVAETLGELLRGRLAADFVPVAIFGLGALVSFSTGTSWGTMGVVMPLAIPVIFALTGEASAGERESLVIAAIGAVFSGAVFGDHCSLFSDTTIVASIASGVEPVDHVRTQLPFAVIGAGVAALCGFVPLGLGAPVWLCLLAGTLLLLGLTASRR